MPDPLIILSPPRSFSSVISTMLGEHPQLYGFPELHLTIGNTVEDVLQREAKRGHAIPPGVARTLAQEHDGFQTTKTVAKAIAWFRERRHWPTKKMFDYFLELVEPKIGVEKSPVTASRYQYLERTYQWFPKARYLHLTRHPLSASQSIQEFYAAQTAKKTQQTGGLKSMVDGLLIWYDMHHRIIQFTESLPLSQVMRVKGEDILSYPDLYLSQIAEWMGIRTDAAAIAAMKHPENSPYACFGPAPARGGNDGKFMRSPRLRSGIVKEPSLQDFFAQGQWEWASDHLQEAFQQVELEPTSSDQVAVEITRLAHYMGYQ
jgi:Sulfotransferase family